tara:strand:- start:162 stop:443 length:282 start_codon:yes stop_codon:yes gene_type:complete
VIGDVVVGKKPWNSKYNVGLVIDEAGDVSKVLNHDTTQDCVSSYKILWTTPKGEDPEQSWEYQLYGVFPKQEVCYTWEVPTSFECISGVSTNG